MKKSVLLIALLFICCFAYSENFWKYKTTARIDDNRNLTVDWRPNWELQPIEDNPITMLPLGYTYWFIDQDYRNDPDDYYLEQKDILMELTREALDNRGNVIIYIARIAGTYKMTAVYVENNYFSEIWVCTDEEMIVERR